MQRDGQPPGSAGDDSGDAGESVVCPLRPPGTGVAAGGGAVVSTQTPFLVCGYAHGFAKCSVAASNFIQLEVFRTSETIN